MPNPKGTGAPSLPMQVMGPGSLGMDAQNKGLVLDPRFGVQLDNWVINDSGALTTRKGVQLLTGPATITGQMHDAYAWNRREVGIDTVKYVVSAGDTVGHFNGVGYTTFAVTGSNPTKGFHFLPFNLLLYGVRGGSTPVKFDGGVWLNWTAPATVAGFVPQFGVSAFGRLWLVDDDFQTIRYCALLDAETWTGVGTGFIDMTSVWPNGLDAINAVATFNGLLVVFGTRSIVFFGDGQGSALGISPANIFVVDTVSGTGCIAGRTIQEVENGDLLFLSDNGLRSLGRTIQEKSNPMTTVSPRVRDLLAGSVRNALSTTGGADKIRATYNPIEGFYLLSFGTVGLKEFCFNTKQEMEDGSYRVTQWTASVYGHSFDKLTQEMIFAPILPVNTTALALYKGTKDVSSLTGAQLATEVISTYFSGWLNTPEAEPFLKIPKQLSINLKTTPIAGEGSMEVIWFYDYQDPTDVPFGVTVPYFFGSAVTNELKRVYLVPMKGFGQVMKLIIGFNSPTTLNSYTLLYKLGRYAR